MVNYRGKKKPVTRPQADKYQNDGYVQTRIALADALAKSERLERELEEERARPRIGCIRCNFTGLMDAIDPDTAEVTVTLCLDCAPVIDQFIERYTGVSRESNTN